MLLKGRRKKTRTFYGQADRKGGDGHRALDGGQFHFWSNLKVPFYVHFWHILVIWDILSHI